MKSQLLNNSLLNRINNVNLLYLECSISNNNDNISLCLKNYTVEFELIKELCQTVLSKLSIFTDNEDELEFRIKQIQVSNEACIEYILMQQLPTHSSVSTLENEVLELLNTSI